MFPLWVILAAPVFAVRRSSLRATKILGTPQSSAPALPVDWYVFTVKRNGSNVKPLASSNIAGPDGKTGFYKMCKETCNMKTSWNKAHTMSTPQLEWCDCIAKLFVEDLNADFSKLNNDTGPVFVMGEYKEVQVSEDLFHIQNGHKVLHTLMKANESTPYHRKSVRITVWVASHIEGEKENTYLGGTTYLDQPLYGDMPGSAVLLNAGESRAQHLLSHEMGHVVGFHHVAGPDAKYVYRGCSDGPVTWKMMSGPNCEPNIMGSFYDGPYCCPFPEAQAQNKSMTADGTCLKNSMSDYHMPYCCGDNCKHTCPKEQPIVTFATHEHKELLGKILSCWRDLKGSEVPAHRKMALLGLVAKGPDAPWVCQDFLGQYGTPPPGEMGPPCVRAT
jgi:hypothetical protein